MSIQKLTREMTAKEQMMWQFGYDKALSEIREIFDMYTSESGKTDPLAFLADVVTKLQDKGAL